MADNATPDPIAKKLRAWAFVDLNAERVWDLAAAAALIERLRAELVKPIRKDV